MDKIKFHNWEETTPLTHIHNKTVESTLKATTPHLASVDGATTLIASGELRGSVLGRDKYDKEFKPIRK